ncbi:MAG: MBL fold metallo-hydrolase [Desulfobacterales bacterium]
MIIWMKTAFAPCRTPPILRAKRTENFITDLGKPHVTEMDWWESADLEDGTRLLCTPMQHWSRRIGQGFNTTLWASYLITAPEVSVYFDGDGGYFKGYREIGRRFPGIDYALIPITAYHPRWFMHYAHMNVSEAVRAFNDLGADIFIPTQWGCFLWEMSLRAILPWTCAEPSLKKNWMPGDF